MQFTNTTAIKLAWGFFKGNYALNFAVLAILIVISLLGAIPIVGMLFVFAYSILSLSVQIYFGKSVERIERVEQIEEVAAQTRVGELLTKYLQVAAGAFLSLFLLSLVFMAIFASIVGMSGYMDMQAMQSGVMMQQEMMATMSSGSGIAGIIVLLVGMFLFYFFPGMMGEVIRAESFNDGFKRVFLLFSPAFWKKCFNKEYFKLVFIWSLILIAVMLVIFALSVSIILLPLVLVVAYLVSLYNAAVYLFAAKLAR